MYNCIRREIAVGTQMARKAAHVLPVVHIQLSRLYFNLEVCNMNDIANLITQYGYSVILMAYFLYKDWKFNENMLSVLNEMQMILSALKEKVME